MNAVCGDHDIGRLTPAIGKGDDRLSLILLEGNALMVDDDDISGQPVDEHGKQIGAVHAIKLNLLAKFGRPHRGDVAAVGASKLWIAPACPPLRHVGPESEPPQHAKSVGLQGNAGADLGQSRRLLVDAHLDALLAHCGGSGGAADTTADDCHAQRAFAHDSTPSDAAALSVVRSLTLPQSAPWLCRKAAISWRVLATGSAPWA